MLDYILKEYFGYVVPKTNTRINNELTDKVWNIIGPRVNKGYTDAWVEIETDLYNSICHRECQVKECINEKYLDGTGMKIENLAAKDRRDIESMNKINSRQISNNVFELLEYKVKIEGVKSDSKRETSWDFNSILDFI